MSKKLILLLALSLFILPVSSRAAVVDKVLAVVNDELITQSELDRILIPIYKQYKTIYEGEELVLKMDEARKKVLNNMINDKLILHKARKQNLEVKPDEIDAKIDQLSAKFPSEEVFEKTLRGEGVTMAELQKRLEEELLKEKFIDTEIRRAIRITPTEINEFYNTNMDNFKMPPHVRALNILIKTKADESKEEARSRAEEILKRLKAGEDFSELATSSSDGADAKNGGEMGFVAKGALKKELDEIIFALEIGQISDVVESEIGYHIFKVLDEKESVIITLEEAHDDIRNILYRQKAQTRYNELIEELKENAYISIK